MLVFIVAMKQRQRTFLEGDMFMVNSTIVLSWNTEGEMFEFVSDGKSSGRQLRLMKHGWLCGSYFIETSGLAELSGYTDLNGIEAISEVMAALLHFLDERGYELVSHAHPTVGADENFYLSFTAKKRD